MTNYYCSVIDTIKSSIGMFLRMFCCYMNEKFYLTNLDIIFDEGDDLLNEKDFEPIRPYRISEKPSLWD